MVVNTQPKMTMREAMTSFRSIVNHLEALEMRAQWIRSPIAKVARSRKTMMTESNVVVNGDGMRASVGGSMVRVDIVVDKSSL